MKRYITGLLIVLLGIVVLLANINFGSTRALLADWWPLGFIIAGLLMLWNSRSNVLWAIFVIGMGGLMLLNNLTSFDINLGDLILPAVLMVFGLSMILNARNSGSAHLDKGTDTEDITAILGGSTNRNTSKKFEGGNITAILGGVELDLSKATVVDGSTVTVFAAMGGVTLHVPENVIVKNRASVLLGGVEDKFRPAEDKHNPVLYLKGTILMGGVDIKR